ncbi:hypothetical protein BG015_007635 [Linnemannia schmuckeri]|uniref:Uncharacterized protein n=1 Tax=Linnemannia schmuckeri TaxID=64567 RepID=A0A9P5RY77_9FUNG|nr:hypothetical protein BG015_007635 [Linnemannia schmuckeri]
MVHQRQHQQSTNGGTGSRAPLLVLGAAALMIQGLLVLPTTANAEAAININTNNNDDASVVANSGSGKVSFDLGVRHNLQTIASLSTGGTGPAGAGPQLWRATSAAAMVSHSNNAATPANLQQYQDQAQEQQKDSLKSPSSALYCKVRLEETSNASVAVNSTTTTPTMVTKNAGVVEEVHDIQSGEKDIVVDGGDPENEDDKKDDVTAVAVAEEEAFSVILNRVSLTIPFTDSNDEKKKSNKKTAATAVRKEEEEKVNDDNDVDVQNENDKSTAADETEIETETEVDTAAKEAADAETSRVGDQIVLDKDGNFVKDVTLDTKAEKKDADVSSTEKNGEPAAADVTSDNTSKSPKSEGDEQEEEEKKDPRAAGDKKTNEDKNGDEGKEVNEDEDDKEAEEAKKDEAVTVIPEGSRKKKTNHHEQAFATLREQLLKQQRQQQQQQQPSTEVANTTEAPVEPDQVTDATTPSIAEDDITTLARAADFVPPEDMRAVMNAKDEKDKKENKKIQSPLTSQQIADTEHQGANAFFELFAADVFPDVKLVGNNQLQDLNFEQRLNKQKKDRKVKAAKKKQQQQDKKDKKVANKKSGQKQQQDRHQNEKRAIAATIAPDITEEERIHAALESIFGKVRAAKIEAEADDSADVEITAQGFGKSIFATAAEADTAADTTATADAHEDGEDAKAIDFDQDLDDEPIGILGAGKKEHHKKKHHKHHAKIAEGDATTVFTTSDDAMDTKNSKDTKDDNNLTPPADSPMSKPSAGNLPDRTIPSPSAGQPKPQQHQPQQPASGAASPASPSEGAPPAGAKGGPVAPSKDETGTAGFGTVPMFGPAQLDLGNSAASLLASRGSIALAFVFGVAWMVL